MRTALARKKANRHKLDRPHGSFSSKTILTGKENQIRELSRHKVCLPPSARLLGVILGLLGLWSFSMSSCSVPAPHPFPMPSAKNGSTTSLVFFLLTHNYVICYFFCPEQISCPHVPSNNRIKRCHKKALIEGWFFSIREHQRVVIVGIDCTVHVVPAVETQSAWCL